AQLTMPDRGGRRGFTLRSPRSLWRVPARTLILHYHVLADRSYVFRIAHRHIDVVVLPIGRLQLRADMRAVLASAADREALAEHTGIVDAMRRFPRTRHLIIVPHDAMANVPFAALPVDGQALCERVAISQIDRLDRLRPRRWRRRSGRCVGIGLASYAGVAPDLPAAEYEAMLVAEATGGQALIDEAATCEGVLGALRDARRVHIAAHGHFDDRDPGDSGILLRDGAGIRTLTLRELRGVDASGVDLATLAVCQSAESAVLPGGMRICLPSALLDAGVRGVIAALWPVEDEPSVAVIGALYRHLATARPAVALARMQAEMQARPQHEWAGLVFYGSE
ncbi:MAG: CHAT domain-containing protein, partial [Myxococcales bacterium]|nr:CHAT domain-containing protein [Myxococcales bacterium]